MVEVFNKGDSGSYEAAIAWFGSLSHMMTILAGTRRKIQEQGATVFRKQVWPRWQDYEDLAGINENELVGIVSRQYASHIAEILGLDSDAKWHPFENYIRPAFLEERAHTGDIFEIDESLWVILTPQCDMATRTVKNVLLACCISKPPIETWKASIVGLSAELESKRKSSEGYLRGLLNQPQQNSHFLPPLLNGQPMMVDFKRLRTIDIAELEAILTKRIASVAPPFLPNLTQRFGSYVSRVGQPNIDPSHLS